MARMLSLPLQTVDAALLALAAADLIVATERIVQVFPFPPAIPVNRTRRRAQPLRQRDQCPCSRHSLSAT